MSARWLLAPRLTFEYHNQTGICFTNTRNYCHRNQICVLTSILKQIYLQPAECARIYCTVNTGVILNHREFPSWRTTWTTMLLLWIRDDVTIVAIDFEWKNVTQTKKRRDMGLTSWLTLRLNRVSMIFLCEYDLTWTRTESHVRLGPCPSQVLS